MKRCGRSTRPLIAEIETRGLLYPVTVVDGVPLYDGAVSYPAIMRAVGNKLADPRSTERLTAMRGRCARLPGMDAVSISRCNTYEPAEVSAALDAALPPIGGMAAFVSPGQRVLLKVNLLSRAIPDGP